MSMVICKLCSNLVDSGEFPDGFYTLKYPDDYVCDSCREKHDLPTQFDQDHSTTNRERITTYMAKILHTSTNCKYHDKQQLIELPGEWLPWRYQIAGYVTDGNGYGNPGRETCTSLSNYETLESAMRYWNATQKEGN